MIFFGIFFEFLKKRILYTHGKRLFFDQILSINGKYEKLDQILAINGKS